MTINKFKQYLESLLLEPTIDSKGNIELEKGDYTIIYEGKDYVSILKHSNIIFLIKIKESLVPLTMILIHTNIIIGKLDIHIDTVDGTKYCNSNDWFEKNKMIE